MSSVVLCGSTEAAQVYMSTPVPVCECNCDYRAWVFMFQCMCTCVCAYLYIPSVDTLSGLSLVIRVFSIIILLLMDIVAIGIYTLDCGYWDCYTPHLKYVHYKSILYYNTLTYGHCGKGIILYALECGYLIIVRLLLHTWSMCIAGILIISMLIRLDERKG